MADERKFFKIITPMELYHMRLPSHLEYGYELKEDFEAALRSLVNRWHGRVGEQIDERNGFRRLRFHDTPGGRPDEEWLPELLLQSSPRPDWLRDPDPVDEIEEEIDRAFGFD